MTRSRNGQLKRECNWHAGNRDWIPRPTFTLAEAEEAVLRIWMLTGVYYFRYRCRKCGHYHIKKFSRSSQRSLRAQGAIPC